MYGRTDANTIGGGTLDGAAGWWKLLVTMDVSAGLPAEGPHHYWPDRTGIPAYRWKSSDLARLTPGQEHLPIKKGKMRGRGLGTYPSVLQCEGTKYETHQHEARTATPGCNPFDRRVNATYQSLGGFVVTPSVLALQGPDQQHANQAVSVRYLLLTRVCF